MTFPLKIAHILPWPSIGGVEIGTLRAANLVEGEKFKSIAYCRPDAIAVREMFASSGYPTALYDAVQPSYRHPSAYWRASRNLARDLKQRGIHVIHCSDLMGAYYAVLAGKLAGIPVMSHIRGQFPDISVKDQSVLWWVKHFVFVCERGRQDFGYREAAKRASVIYDGIAIPSPAPDGADVREEFKIPPAAPVIGMVARVAPAKDYETLIKAAALVRRRFGDVRFLIVGDHSSTAPYREHYGMVQGLLRAAGLESNFIFSGARADVNRLTAAMDICVLCTNTEGLPLVLLEAMALRKPVVATAVGGVPELLREGQNGLMHRHADAEDLAAKLISLLQDPAWAETLAENGYQDVAQRFSVRTNAANLERAYLTLADRLP